MATFGSGTTIVNAVDSLRRGGTAILVGLGSTTESAPIAMVDMVRDQKTLMGSYYGSASPHETFDKLIGFYLQGRLDVESLVSRVYSLDQINEGFDALDRGEDGRGIIRFDKS